MRKGRRRDARRKSVGRDITTPSLCLCILHLVIESHHRWADCSSRADMGLCVAFC